MVLASRKHVRLAEVALLGVAAIFGLTFVMVQDAIAELPTLPFLAYRFLLAGACIALVFHWQLRLLRWESVRAGVFVGAFLLVGYLAQTLGLERTSAAHAGFITGLYVVLTPLFSVVLGNRLGLLPWIAAALAAAGLFLLSGADQQGAAVGDLLELLCAAAFACHVLATNWATHRHPVGVLLTVQFALGGLVFLALAAGQGTLQPPRSGSVIVALLVTGVLASALAFFVQTYAQRYASPTRTALILASESAFAGLASYVFQNNRLTIAGWVGAGLILVAIVGVELLPRLRQPVATHVSR